jgi:hypothetical protein
MKQFLTYLFIALFALFAVSCKKDKDENEKVQLVKTITTKITSATPFGDDVFISNYEYDDKNRITTIKFGNAAAEQYQCHFIYSGDDLVKVEYETNGGHQNASDVSKNGNEITVSSYNGEKIGTIKLNSEGYPIFILRHNYAPPNLTNFHYFDGNIVSTDDGQSLSYGGSLKYDNKKSPFYHCKTPKWALIYFCSGLQTGWLNEFRYIKNNPIEIICYEEDWWGNILELKTEYTYEYDENGFVTKRVNHVEGEYEEGTITYY